MHLSDGVEVDIRSTKDNVLLCLHDKSLLRTAGLDRKLKDLKYEEVKNIDVGSWFSSKWSKETLPSIEKVLRLIPEGKKIFIEVKEEGLTDNLIEEINKSPVNNDCIRVISFYENVIKEIKEKTNLKANLLISFTQQNISVNALKEKLVELKADGIGAENHKLLNKEFVNEMRSVNKETHVWTVDDSDKALEYLKMGIASITTNIPKKIKETIQKN